MKIEQTKKYTKTRKNTRIQRKSSINNLAILYVKRPQDDIQCKNYPAKVLTKKLKNLMFFYL